MRAARSGAKVGTMRSPAAAALSCAGGGYAAGSLGVSVVGARLGRYSALYLDSGRMKCPHCLESFHTDDDDVEKIDLESDREYSFTLVKVTCPACGRMILNLRKGIVRRYEGRPYPSGRVEQQAVHPKVPARKALGAEIPSAYVSEYREALVVLSDSPKASAAISRRLLQRLIREVIGVQKQGDLSSEIDQVLASHKLPSDVADSIDAIRNVGNFAAHPIKSTNTGEIVDVEPGEAEWLIDVIEDLFDALFSRPELQKKRMAALDAKLKDAGKPPMKAPPT